MIKINLLPKEARKRVGIWDQIFILAAILILTFGGIGFTWRYLNGVIEQKQAAIEKTKQRLAELQKVIDEIKAFEKQRAALEQKLQVIAKLEKEQKLPVHLLDELYLTLVDDMWLRGAQQAAENLSLQGSALSNPVVANYMKSLEKSFENVELVISQARVVGTREVRDFQITATLKIAKEQPEGAPPQPETPPK
jgi:type IV pilus assembly protein PilN